MIDVFASLVSILFLVVAPFFLAQCIRKNKNVVKGQPGTSTKAEGTKPSDPNANPKNPVSAVSNVDGEKPSTDSPDPKQKAKPTEGAKTAKEQSPVDKKKLQMEEEKKKQQAEADKKMKIQKGFYQSRSDEDDTLEKIESLKQEKSEDVSKKSKKSKKEQK